MKDALSRLAQEMLDATVFNDCSYRAPDAPSHWQLPDEQTHQRVSRAKETDNSPLTLETDKI